MAHSPTPKGDMNMIVAGIQMDIAWEDPEENFRRVEAMVRRGMNAEPPRSTPDLLVLPEMFATGFTMDSSKAAAFSDRTREFLATLAQGLGLHVLGGYAEPSEPRPANACSLFGPDGGEMLHFRKLHPFSFGREDEHYVAGDSLVTADVEGTRVTPLICYDLRFPEPFRTAADDTDLFCVIANWPAKRDDAWSTLLRARAMENQAYVLGVNRVGRGGGEDHSGGSALLDPLGRAADETVPEASHAGVVWGTVDPDEVASARAHFSALKDRRLDLYRRLEARRAKEAPTRN